MPEPIIQTQDNIELIDMEQILRNAKMDGEKKARSGSNCQTRAVLLKKYCAQAVDAYIQGYEEHLKNPNVLQIAKYNALKAIEKSGGRYRRVGNHGGQRPELETLIKRNKYTKEQAEAYLKGFDKADSTEEKRALIIAKHMARLAAKRGYKRASVESLKQKNNFTDAQIEAYLQKYDESAGTAEEQELQRAKNAACKQATDIGKCQTRDALLERYSEKAADYYLQIFNETIERTDIVKTSEHRALMKAKKAGAAYARMSKPRPTPDYLKFNNNYTDELVEAYLQSFDRVKSKNAINVMQEAKSTDTTKPSETIKDRKVTKARNEQVALTHNDLQNSDNNSISQMAPNCFLPSFDSFCRVANSVANKVLLPSFKTLVEGADTINPLSTSLRK